MLSDKQKRIVQLAIILTGIILGGLLLPPILNNNSKASGFLGGFIGFLISVAIFPETIKGLFEEQSELRQKRLQKEMAMGFWQSWTYPTQIPMTIGVLWFLVYIVLISIFHTIFEGIDDKALLALIFLLPPFFLFGLSGLLMILRKEGVDKHGKKYFGVWVYINGISQMTICWGVVIILTLSTIFDW
jgi:hypothetical protein